MGTYPCSNCGATADTAIGCPECGRSLDAEILDLDRTISSMQRRSKGLAEDRAAVMGRLQGAIAIRTVLQRAAVRHESTSSTPRSTTKARPMDIPVKRTRAARNAPAGGGVATATRPRPSTSTAAPPPKVTVPQAARQADAATPPPHPPETSTRSTQNIVLGVGAAVMAIALILTPILYGHSSGAVRGFVLVVLSVIALAAPALLARFELITTAEWISPLGLLLILLDADELWTAQIRHTGLPGPVFAGIAALIAAAAATGYQFVAKNLAVPRFATVVLLQPVPALLLFHWLTDLSAWAAVITMVAALDLIIAWYIHEESRGHGRYLRVAVRSLQELVTAGAIVFASIGLMHVHGAHASIRAGAPLVTAAIVALASGLLFRQRPAADISAGVATLAAIGGFGRMGAMVLPGWGLTATAIAIAACAIGVYLLPAYARTGAQIAGGAAAALTTVVIVLRGWSALSVPLRASSPAWHANLSDYSARLSRDVSHHAGQLVIATLLLGVAAAIMLPDRWRRDCLVIAVALAAILMPGAWHLPWVAAILVGAVLSLLLGGFALTAQTQAQSWIGIATAFAVGGYATGLSVARPGGQALLLGALAIGGAAIASVGVNVVQVAGRTPDRRVVEASWGAAAFALPGAIAATTASAAPQGAIVPEAVMVSAFMAVAATLTAAAITQVAVRRPIPLLVGGAGLGALVTAIAAINTHGLAQADLLVALLLLASAILLAFSPRLNTGYRPIGAGRLRVSSLDGEEIAAATVTVAAIVAFARVVSLIAPQAFLIIVAALVAAIAAGARSLPITWRRGPVVGGGVVGVVVAVAGAYAAFDVAITAIRLNKPIWHVPFPGWTDRLDAHTISLAHGPQAAAALLLIALAAAIVVPKRESSISVAITLGLAALLLPQTLHADWWGPIALSGLGATVGGIAAALSRDRVVAMVRAGVATLLFANTIAASLVRGQTTATTLIVSAGICAAVAATAAITIRSVRAGDTPNEDVSHLVFIGGGALAGAILALAGGSAVAAAAADQSLNVILTAAMGGLALALAILALVAQRIEPLLPQASVAISVSGLGIALASAAHLTTAGVFAAFAALLAVLMEVLRSAVTRSLNREQAAARSSMMGWFPQRTGVLLAAGPATALAVASVAGSLVAALFGPYHWIGEIWRGAPATFGDQLGSLTSWVGAPVGLVTAVVLTVMATIGAIGFGGSRTTIAARAVAVITPGVAICLFTGPYLLRALWPTGALAALAVATISGLALALSVEPPDTDAASALSFARKVVIGTCVLGAGAGIAGSLATRSMTIVALVIATATGLVAALYGRAQVSRVTGWVVTATAGQLLALVASLIGGMPRYDAAFVVALVAAALLITAAGLPRLRRPEAVTENLTLEVSAYAGAVLALVLAASSIPHLAVFLGAWGAVLGVAAGRPQRSATYRSALMWAAAAHELGAWFLLLAFSHVAVPETYTLGIAVIALVIGTIELRWHPGMKSWVAYGVALAAALGPSLVLVIGGNTNTLRIVLLLIGATAVLLFGAFKREQAPMIIGGVALLATTIDLLARFSSTILVLVLLALIAAVLIGVGSSFEKQRRNLSRAWTAFNKKPQA